MRHLKPVLTCALLVVLACGSLLAQGPAPTNTWIDSPEAMFLTNDERAEWWTLANDAERKAFRERYWAQRDPTPGTPRNEFREHIEHRIALANKQYKIASTPGSETARGFVLVLLGTPARAENLPTHQLGGGQPQGIGANESTDIQVRWFYDTLKTPKLLEMLGRPSLTVNFFIQPNRRRDELQDPGLITSIRETLAQRSIVTRIPLSTIIKADTAPEPMPGPALSADAVSLLDQSSKPSSTLQSATFWSANGAPMTILWFVAPRPAPGAAPTLYGRIRDAEQRQVVSIARQIRPSPGFTLNGTDVVLAIRVVLPPGAYQTAFVAQQPGIAQPLATTSARVVVPESGSKFAVSSLLLTDSMTPQSAEGGAVSLGGVGLRPRADAIFTTAESLWYAFEVMNLSDPSAVKLTIALRRRDNNSVQTNQIPAGLQKVSDRLFVGGYEMPLAGVAPGDYSLYVTVADANGTEESRRADFQVLPAVR